jgi:hypothetical protein
MPKPRRVANVRYVTKAEHRAECHAELPSFVRGAGLDKTGRLKKWEPLKVRVTRRAKESQR